MKLTKYQKQAVGSSKSLPKFIWNNHMSKIYKPIDQKNLDLSDGQTFDEFLQMEKRDPNQFGTGRYKFNRISKIQYFFIKNNKASNPPLKTIQTIDQFVTTFLRIPAEHRKELKMTVDKNNIIHKANNVVYTVKQLQNRLDVYDLLDILMEYREEGTVLLAFVEKELQEEGDELDGRACGDGVAVVAYNQQDFINTELLLQTTTHEILHTLGFDHCVAWKCLMNAWTNFESWLCPACSRKLYHELNLTNESGAKQWIESILSLGSIKNKRKGEQLIRSFQIE